MIKPPQLISDGERWLITIEATTEVDARNFKGLLEQIIAARETNRIQTPVVAPAFPAQIAVPSSYTPPPVQE